MRQFLFVVTSTLLVLFSTSARAETWQAPIGGKAIPLAEGRVVCSGAGDWAVEQDGHAVRPPASDAAIGQSVDVKVAPAAAACAAEASTLTLVATGRWPAIDEGETTLFVDDGRIELRGRGLRGAIVRWVLADRSGQDRCVSPQTDATGERCAVAVGRGLPADPTVVDLGWLPAGARASADVVTWDAAGRRASPEEMLLRAGRIVTSSLVPPGVSIDLAGGTASRIPLVHPEAVVGVDCGAASCAVSGNVIVVGGLASVSSGLPVRLRLAPRVVLQRGDAFDAAPILQVPVLPCPMSIASGDALRDVDATRAVVRVDSRCAGEARTLRWFSAGRALDVLAAVDKDGATYVLLGVGRVEGDELVVTASRGEDASIVGQARARARSLPPPQASLALDGGQAIEFLPTNRPATVQWGAVQEGGELVLLPLEGVYSVSERNGATLVQARRGAGGFVALRFGWRVPSLPGPLSTAHLAVVVDPVERPMHAANVPVPLGASALGPTPLVELAVRVRPHAATNRTGHERARRVRRAGRVPGRLPPGAPFACRWRPGASAGRGGHRGRRFVAARGACHRVDRDAGDRAAERRLGQGRGRIVQSGDLARVPCGRRSELRRPRCRAHGRAERPVVDRLRHGPLPPLRDHRDPDGHVPGERSRAQRGSCRSTSVSSCGRRGWTARATADSSGSRPA